MKKIIVLLFSFALLFICSCSNSDGGNPTSTGIGGGGGGGIGGDGGGGGGGNTGNVTFTVAVAQEQQSGNYYFQFTPSTSIVVNSIRGQCAALNIDETVTDNGTDVYGPNAPFYIGPIEGLQTGVQWTFTIAGKIGSAQGQAYNTKFNWTVP